MSPTFLYLGNPEELRDGVGDIFAVENYAEPEFRNRF